MENKKEKIGKNKRVIAVVCCFIILIIAITITIKAIKGKENEKSDYQYTPTPEISKVLKNNTQTEQGNIQLTDVKIDSIGATIIARAKIVNNGARIKQAKPTLYLYDKEQNMRGKSSIKIENLNAKDTAEIEMQIIGEYADLDKYELKIEEIER